MLLVGLASNYDLHFIAIRKHILPLDKGGYFSYQDFQKSLVAYWLSENNLSFTSNDFHLHYCFMKGEELTLRTISKHLNRLKRYGLIESKPEVVKSNLCRHNWSGTPLLTKLMREFERILIDRAITIKSGSVTMPPIRPVKKNRYVPNKYKK